MKFPMPIDLFSISRYNFCSMLMEKMEKKMPGVVTYTNLVAAEARSVMFGCSVTGSGFYTRPAVDHFLPVPVAHDQVSMATCPELKAKTFYSFTSHKMFMHLPPCEYALFLELLAMALGYEKKSTLGMGFEPSMIPEESHLFGCITEQRTELPHYWLIARGTSQLVFHGNRLALLVGEFKEVLSQFGRGHLRFANGSWFQKKLERHLEAAAHAMTNKGAFVLAM